MDWNTEIEKSEDVHTIRKNSDDSLLSNMHSANWEDFRKAEPYNRNVDATDYDKFTYSVWNNNFENELKGIYSNDQSFSSWLENLTERKTSQHSQKTKRSEPPLEPYPICDSRSTYKVSVLDGQQIGLLSQLPSCKKKHSSQCSDLRHRGVCLGVPGCEWCHLSILGTPENLWQEFSETPQQSSSHRRSVSERSQLNYEYLKNTSLGDNNTGTANEMYAYIHLPRPGCVEHHRCPGGVLGEEPSGELSGGHSSPGLSQDVEQGGEGRRAALPIAPVISIVVGGCVVIAVASVYCYNSQRDSQPALYASVRQQMDDRPPGDISRRHVDQLNEVAIVSPYRVNPHYRRPNNKRESSDPGYSTMTDPLQQSSSSTISCRTNRDGRNKNLLSVRPTSVRRQGRKDSAKGSRSNRRDRQISSEIQVVGVNDEDTVEGSSDIQEEDEETSDEEYDEENRSSSSTSRVFRDVAHSSLLSGNHAAPTLNWSVDELRDRPYEAPPTLDWSGNELRDRPYEAPPTLDWSANELRRQCFEDLDGNCTHCGGPMSIALQSYPGQYYCHNCGFSDDDNLDGYGSETSPEDSNYKLASVLGDAKNSSEVNRCLESNTLVGQTSFNGKDPNSPKKVGPNIVVVPVTVHMVDS